MTETYLLTWNPKLWSWDSLPTDARRSADGEVVRESWSCGNTKRIKAGDRLLLIQLGKGARGIVGSGWALTEPKVGEHWDPERAADGAHALFVDAEFERLLDPNADELLDYAALQQLAPEFNWSPQASGVTVPPDVAARVEAAWSKHLAQTVLAGSIGVEVGAFEGELRLKVVRHRRRERRVRDAKLDEMLRRLGRIACEVPGCGFDFERVYGPIGRRFAHVHHLKPLASLESPRLTRLDDVAVVCANCHEMIHVGGKCRSLEGLVRTTSAAHSESTR